MILLVEPILNPKVRGLCCLPYEGHPKGCPNFGKAERCPPQAPKFEDVVDLSKPVYAIVNSFDIAAHVERMRARHPDWSERQLLNCLYWQGTARKALRKEIKSFLAEHPDYEAHETPEAMGVNVTATLAAVGVALEWPPRKVAMQVAIAGIPKWYVTVKRRHHHAEVS